MLKETFTTSHLFIIYTQAITQLEAQFNSVTLTVFTVLEKNKNKKIARKTFKHNLIYTQNTLPCNSTILLTCENNT